MNHRYSPNRTSCLLDKQHGTGDLQGFAERGSGPKLGRADASLLATMPDDQVRRLYVDERLPTETPTAISTVSQLLADLHRIRERGCAVDDEESCIGIECVAVPVFGISREALFAISVTRCPSG